MAHSLGKDVVLIAEKGESLPFDIAAVRVVFYEQSVAGTAELKQRLKEMLCTLLEK